MALHLMPKEESLRMAGPPPTWGYDNYLDAEPPMSFFRNAPHDSPAFFSTELGRKARRFEKPSTPRDIHAWTAHQIQSAVDRVGTDCWEIRKAIRKPQHYGDLYTYWDAYDLYYMGVQNAWNVLNCLYLETQNALPGIIEKARIILGDWCIKLLNNPSCRAKLYYWSQEKVADVLHVFDATEKMDLQGIDMFWLPAVRDLLVHAHNSLHMGTWPEIDDHGLDQLDASEDSPPSIASQITAIERHAFHVPEMPLSFTASREIKGVTIADGTSATAAKVLKEQAESGGAAPESSVPSPRTKKMLDAVASTGNGSSPASSHEESVEGATHTIHDTLIVLAGPSSGKRSPTKRPNPMRPEPAGPIYKDSPSECDDQNNGSEQSRSDFIHRKSPTSSIDGPPAGRLDAIPEPIYSGPLTQPVPYKQASHQVTPNQEVVQDPRFRNQVPASEENLAQYDQGLYGVVNSSHWYNRQLSTGKVMDAQSLQRHVAGMEANEWQSTNQPGMPLHEPSVSQLFREARRPQTLQRKEDNAKWQPGNVNNLHGKDLHGPTVHRLPSKKQDGPMQSYPSQFHNPVPPHARSRQLNNGFPAATLERSFADRRLSHTQSAMPPHELYRPDQAPISNSSHAAGLRSSQSPGSFPRDRRDTTLSYRPADGDECLNYAAKMSPERAFHSYQACPCLECYTKDCSVFIGSLYDGVMDSPTAMRKMHDVFSKFGFIVHTASKTLGRALLIQYTNPSDAFAAIEQMNNKPIEGISRSALVSHPIGSRYFRPWIKDRPRKFSPENGRGFAPHRAKPDIIPPHRRDMLPVPPRVGDRQPQPLLSDHPLATDLVPLDRHPWQNRSLPTNVFSDASGAEGLDQFYAFGRSNILNGAATVEALKQQVFDSPPKNHLPSPLPEAIQTGNAPSDVQQNPSAPHPILDSIDNFALTETEESPLMSTRGYPATQTAELDSEAQTKASSDMMPGSPSAAATKSAVNISPVLSYASAVKIPISPKGNRVPGPVGSKKAESCSDSWPDELRHHDQVETTRRAHSSDPSVIEGSDLPTLSTDVSPHGPSQNIQNMSGKSTASSPRDNHVSSYGTVVRRPQQASRSQLPWNEYVPAASNGQPDLAASRGPVSHGIQQPFQHQYPPSEGKNKKYKGNKKHKTFDPTLPGPYTKQKRDVDTTQPGSSSGQAEKEVSLYQTPYFQAQYVAFGPMPSSGDPDTQPVTNQQTRVDSQLRQLGSEHPNPLACHPVYPNQQKQQGYAWSTTASQRSTEGTKQFPPYQDPCIAPPSSSPRSLAQVTAESGDAQDSRTTIHTPRHSRGGSIASATSGPDTSGGQKSLKLDPTTAIFVSPMLSHAGGQLSAAPVEMTANDGPAAKDNKGKGEHPDIPDQAPSQPAASHQAKPSHSRQPPSDDKKHASGPKVSEHRASYEDEFPSLSGSADSQQQGRKKDFKHHRGTATKGPWNNYKGSPASSQPGPSDMNKNAEGEDAARYQTSAPKTENSVSSTSEGKREDPTTPSLKSDDKGPSAAVVPRDKEQSRPQRREDTPVSTSSLAPESTPDEQQPIAGKSSQGRSGPKSKKTKAKQKMAAVTPTPPSTTNRMPTLSGDEFPELSGSASSGQKAALRAAQPPPVGAWGKNPPRAIWEPAATPAAAEISREAPPAPPAAAAAGPADPQRERSRTPPSQQQEGADEDNGEDTTDLKSYPETLGQGDGRKGG
ncbi:hypothetical protein JX266_011204 [Neoarthrinium moseri]|nr:hypothetical protein JX266_011204 [Neoarthrinium moseri]